MANRKYSEIVRMSWDKTTQILFKPFNLKKWVFLGLIIMLAGQLGSGGGNYNIGKKTSKAGQVKSVSGKMNINNIFGGGIPGAQFKKEDIKKAGLDMLENLKKTVVRKPLFGIMFSVSIVAILAAILIWILIMSIFIFVYIESIVRNDASVRVPFHKNVHLGRSLFLWNIGYGIVSLVVSSLVFIAPVIALFSSGIFSDLNNIAWGSVLSVLTPYIAGFILFFILSVFISTCANDFVPTIMYSKNVGVLKAWRLLLDVMNKKAGKIFGYLIVKLGLGILSLIAFLIIAALALIVMLIIGGIVGLIGFLIFMITPVAAKVPVIIVLTLIGVPIAIVLVLPIPVFFRAFAIYSLLNMDESYDVFTQAASIRSEQEKEKYHKPLIALWLSLLFPFIPMLLTSYTLYLGGGDIFSFDMPKFAKFGGQIIQQDTVSKPVSRDPDKMSIIYMKNGNAFEAEVLEETEQSVMLGIEGGTITVHRDDIAKIEKK